MNRLRKNELIEKHMILMKQLTHSSIIIIFKQMQSSTDKAISEMQYFVNSVYIIKALSVSYNH